MVAAPSTTPPPPADLASSLIELLHSPDLSLRDIADQLNLSLYQLTLLLTTDGEALDLLTTTLNLHTLRARLAATALIPQVLRSLQHTLRDHDTHVRNNTATEPHHTRALRAATLIVRIARGTTSRSMGVPPTRTSPPGGGVAARFGDATEGATSPPSSSAPHVHTNPSIINTASTTAHFASRSDDLRSAHEASQTPQPPLSAPTAMITSRDIRPHAEGVEVNGVGSPRSGTPRTHPTQSPHRAAVLVPARVTLSPSHSSSSHPSPAHLPTSSPAHPPHAPP